MQPSSQRFCGRCGVCLQPGWSFCGGCRTPLQAAVRTAGRSPDEERASEAAEESVAVETHPAATATETRAPSAPAVEPPRAVTPVKMRRMHRVAGTAGGPRDQRLVWPGGFLLALILFAIGEAGGAVVLTRLVLPDLVGRSGSSQLTALRDETAILIYGSTLGAAMLTAGITAGWGRRSHRRTAAGLIAALVGTGVAIAIALVIAAGTEQPIIGGALVTHALVAALGVAVGVVIPGMPGRFTRARLVQLVAAAVCVASCWQIAAPSPVLAAGEIGPGDCRLETWSGSVDGSVTLFSFDAGLGFTFAIGRNLDRTWDLETAASIKLGFKISVGRKVEIPDIGALSRIAAAPGDILDAGKLSLELTNDGIVTISHRYRFASDSDLWQALLGSLATFAWHAQALPGLGALLGDGPVMPPALAIPEPAETDYEALGATAIDVGIGPLSFSGDVSSGLRVRFNRPNEPTGGDAAKPASFDIGFPTSASISGELAAAPAQLAGAELSTTRDMSGEIYTYLTFNRTNDDLTFEGTTLDAYTISATGRAWSPPGSEPDLGTSLITSMAHDSGFGGSIASITTALGPAVAHDVSLDVDASLSGISDPGVASAILTIALLSVEVADTHEYDLLTSAYPELRQLTSRTAVVGALETIITHSKGTVFVHSSDKLEAGLAVGGGAVESFGAGLKVSGSHERIVSAAVLDSAGFDVSKSCVAGG